jgi:hypothetical protein
MADTERRLAAIDQLLEDFEVIAIEKLVVADWIDGKLSRHDETYVLAADRVHVQAANRGLLQMKYDSLLDAETYREYADGLRQRRLELLSAGAG